MRLDDEAESTNVEDARGSGGGGFPGLGGGGFGLPLGGRGLGCGGIAVVIVLALVFGVNPLQLLGGGGPVSAPTQQVGQPTATGQAPAGAESDRDRFVRKVLHSTERTWAQLLPAQTGTEYTDPKLLLYNGSYPGGCGNAQAAMGPFYCPNDQKVYLDQSFFDELSQKFGAPGDFAAAYVIAHEIGHHVQHLLGIIDKASAMQERASKSQGNAIQVRVELQADCFAGVWANANKALLETGDVDEAMKAAASVGDDRLQQQARGVVIPDSFTHGSSAQRTHWFQRGLERGKLSDCDTFAQGV